MNIADLLQPELIICDLQGNDRASIYHEMLSRLQEHRPQVSSIDSLYEEIIDHEKLIDMPYSFGFAIPHTRSSSINDFHIVVGIHKHGVLLQEDDQTPSKVIILSLISKGTSNIYLLTLKAICSYFSKPENSDKITLCNTPQNVIQQLVRDKVEVKHSITAEDIMLKDFPSIEQSAVLKEAIDLLATSDRNQLPVLNNHLDFIGSISIESILKAGVPDYILMMDHVAFLSDFEPFEQVLANEDSLPLDKFINLTPDTCNTETHLMQIVADLLKKKVTCFYVLDDKEKLVGLISKKELLKNLLRR